MGKIEALPFSELDKNTFISRYKTPFLRFGTTEAIRPVAVASLRMRLVIDEQAQKSRFVMHEYRRCVRWLEIVVEGGSPEVWQKRKGTSRWWFDL